MSVKHQFLVLLIVVQPELKQRCRRADGAPARDQRLHCLVDVATVLF